MANQHNICSNSGYNYTLNTVYPIDYRQYRNFVTPQDEPKDHSPHESLFSTSDCQTVESISNDNDLHETKVHVDSFSNVHGNYQYVIDDISNTGQANSSVQNNPLTITEVCQDDKLNGAIVNRNNMFDKSVEDTSTTWNEMPVAVDCIKVENIDESEIQSQEGPLIKPEAVSEDDESSEDSEDTKQGTLIVKLQNRKIGSRVKNKSKQKTLNNLRCKHCDRQLNSKRALQNHENLHVGKYSCSVCMKYFNSQNSLDTHAKVHEGYVGNEICQVCDKTFYDISSLNKHIRSVHMGIKNFQCTYCDKSFYAKKTFDEHVRVHTGEKPFKCTLCPKSYKRGSDLNHHIRLHKGEVSHTCEFCGEGFRRISELKRHMQKHNDKPGEVVPSHKEKKCYSCGLCFSTMKALNEHMNEHMMCSLQCSSAADFTVGRFTAEKKMLVNEIVQELGNNVFVRNVQRDCDSASQVPHSDIDKNSQVGCTSSPNHCSPNPCQSTWCNNDKDRSLHDEQSLVKVDEACKNPLIYSVNIISGTAVIEPCKVIPEDLSVSGNKVGDDGIKTEILEKKSDNQNKVIVTESEIKLEGLSEEEDVDEQLAGFESSDEDFYTVQNVDDDNSDTDEYEPYIYKRKPSKTQKKYVSKQNITNDIEKDNELETQDANTKTNKGKAKSKSSVQKKKCARTKKRMKDKVSGVEDGGGLTKSNQEHDSEQDEFVVKIRKTKKYVCEECGKTVSSLNCFKKHMNLHAGTFTCGICSKSFASKMSLNMHIENHEGKRDYTSTCNVCDKSFYDSSSLNKHVKNVHMNFRPYPCPSCDRRFSEKKTLVEHIRTHTGERPFPCEICGKAFKRASELNFHLKKHTGETKLTCSECGKGFLRQSELRNHHMMKHTSDKPFPCTFCSKQFGSKPSLKEHLLTHIALKGLECTKCGKGFSRKAKLDKHLNMKGDCSKNSLMVNGLHTCKFCFLEIDDYNELEKHVKEVHESVNGKKLFHCKVCFKEFGRTQALKRHLKIHYNVRDYTCTVCNASFIQQHHLKQHMRTHTGEKPFQCTICTRSFAQSSTLYSHMKHH